MFSDINVLHVLGTIINSAKIATFCIKIWILRLLFILGHISDYLRKMSKYTEIFRTFMRLWLIKHYIMRILPLVVHVGIIICHVTNLRHCSRLWYWKNKEETHVSWYITCWASSRVGERISAWHSDRSVSILCNTAVEKVAVFPVPDWAWAMTSYPEKKLKIVKNRSIMPLMVWFN